MSIPTNNTPSTGIDDVDVAPDITDVSNESDILRRSERDRRTRELLRATDDESGAFAFLLLLFSNVTDENGEKLIDDGIIEQISQALGIDLAPLQQTITNLSAGTTTPREAATQTYEQVTPENVDWSKASNVQMSDIVRPSNSPTLLNPDLVARMETHPEIRQRVQWTFEAAQREGLDGNLLANQYWQESRFDPNAGSEAGARGIAQFMPFHQGKWGLTTSASFLDAQTSIDAGARFMKHLTDKLGSQELALIAYNGGERAINYVDRNVSGDGINVEQWMEFMHQERLEKGVGARNLWRNQTYEYVALIDSKYWEPEQIALAQSQQSALAAQFAQGGVEINDPAQPDPLVASFDGEGRDETILADNTDLNPLSSDATVTTRPGLS